MSDEHLVPPGARSVGTREVGTAEGFVDTLEHDLGLSSPRGKQRRPEWVQLPLDALHYRVTQVGLAMFLLIVTLVVVGPYVAPHSPFEFVADPYAKPSAIAWLGGDGLGRDVLSRVLCGGRSVLILSFSATAIGMVLGVSTGLVAGYARTVVSEVIMRGLDVLLAFPQIVFVLLLVSVLGPQLWLLVLGVGVTLAPPIGRVVYGATMEIKEREFVLAAEALGVSHLKIAFTEILPSIVSPLMVEFGLNLTFAIGTIASLNFLGFGMQPPAADWGVMINENRIGLVVQPYSVLVPAALIAILAIGVNLVTDGAGHAMIGIKRDTGSS